MSVRMLLAGAALAAGSLVAGAVLWPPATGTAASSSPAVASARQARVAAESAMALLQRARDEAEPAHLPQAEAALGTSLRAQPVDNVPAFVGMAALANARHDFSSSVRWSRRAIAADPYNASAYGLLGDALFELGQVRESNAAYQDMVDRRPDTASYVRASYALQHQGATAAAVRALKLAGEAAGPVGETAAFVQHQLGDVYAAQGLHGRAERANRTGLAMAPGFIPPTVGIAESYIARGRMAEAVPLLENAVAQLPAIEYQITLGDVYRALGRDRRAEAVYGRVARTLASYRRNGVQPDADFIVFYADHGLRPRAALREAFAIYANRPTGKVADALAWMLHAVGRDREAQRYARQAICAAGASALEFAHAAEIARARGDTAAGARLQRRAERLDPVWAAGR